jgi:hypothetical protein
MTNLEPVIVDKNAFVTPQANAVWVAITGCWSAEAFIPELCHKFWRLTLQVSIQSSWPLQHTREKKSRY